MKKAIILLGIFIALAASGWGIRAKMQAASRPEFTFSRITRGSLDTSISSTGTLYPVVSVDIGTQVSGKIDHISVDFNSTVRQGEVLALIDTTLLVTSVLDAEAEIAKSQATYDTAKNNYDRNLEMYKKNYISEFDLISLRTTMESALAGLQSAQLALNRAKTNLGYAVIRSPISGKVIYKNVEEGQTVAASFSTPTLFTIAADLTKMEIRALVDESDIGKIHEGQKVTFTVESYTDRTFSGQVRQIWLQPTTVQNVVNYTVIIDAQNAENLLLPGMTATVDFVSENAAAGLLVPNIALVFQPPANVLQEYEKEAAKSSAGQTSAPTGGSRGAGRGERAGIGSGGTGENSRKPNAKTGAGKLWSLDPNGRLVLHEVRLGDTDGRNTEILGGQNVSEGMSVLSGIVSHTPPGAQGNRGTGIGRMMF
jgi:HlyD family secretion protein